MWQTLSHVQTGVERAKQEMITRNLRLVISVAREFSHTGLPLTDLIQEGQYRFNARGRKVRLSPQSEVQHLCYLVDQTGHATGDI